MSHNSDIEDSASVLEETTRMSDHTSISSLRNWSIPKLTAELVRRGIPYPATARKAELYRLLSSDTAGPSNEEVSNCTLHTSLTQLHALVNSLSSSLTDMQSRVEAIENRDSVPPTPQVPIQTPTHAAPTGTPPAIPTISPAHFIPPHIKKDILDGKDINLASLVIATHDLMENKTIACGDVSVVLKSKDVRLSRKLSLSEFIMAFSIYRDIICTTKPERREELDHYLYKVTELSHKFYDYHRSFSAKAAAALGQFGYTINWASIDTEIFCTHFAGLKTPVCARCQASSHTAEWCSSSSTEVSGALARTSSLAQPRVQKSSGIVDKLGRPIRYLGKSQICNNFNYTACNYNQCRLLHVCAICFRAHPKVACPQKSEKS
ncbi:uncharacterized protein LOC130368988 isoform X2 [Hyla sarda]|uniref:uncharacterized protein LOC130368988 isoform X2 n=1 Tax=Hyla sarda TaxID=327740 RepID=UPI0024C431AD|nr:uncharacterized protein LOC130368988 isoform X2 [Hyla sarda]